MNEPETNSGVANYMWLCAAALAVVLLALTQRGMGAQSLIPILLGGLGLYFRWRIAPLIFLFFLVLMLFIQEKSYPMMVADEADWSWVLPELILCAAVLAFIAGHYRLQSLDVRVYPRDPRLGAQSTPRYSPLSSQSFGSWWRRSSIPTVNALDEVRRAGESQFAALLANLPASEQRRSSESISKGELSRLVVLLPSCALFALLIWILLLARQEEAFGLIRPLWRLFLLLWLAGLGALVITGLLGYRSQGKLTPEEARLFLQDLLWRETRREQTRLNRWLAWAKLRRQARGEKS